MKPMTNEQFEHYWQQHRNELLAQNGEYMDAKRNLGMHTGADWLLFGIPAIAGIMSFNWVNLSSELLRWAVSAVITIVCFVLCVWVKSVLSGDRSLDEIEADVKEKTCRQMTES